MAAYQIIFFIPKASPSQCKLVGNRDVGKEMPKQVEAMLVNFGTHR
jgi:hypothetical protein